MNNKDDIKKQLYAIKGSISEEVEKSYSLSSQYFRLRDIIEKYFPNTFYHTEIVKTPHTFEDDENLYRAKNILDGIIDGLIKKIDLDDIEISSNEGQQINELLIRSENLAKEIELERIKSKEYADQIRDLSNNLENEKQLLENRYAELAKVELLKQEDIFTKAAKSNKCYSWFWLVAIVISSLGIICLLSHFVNEFCLDLSCLLEQKKSCPDCGNTLLIFELTRATIYRVAIISLAVYFIVFVIKNYNALMHNYTVNTQKANSFAAAFVMINGATTNKAKNDIMLQAAQAIFSHQNTGYLGKDTEPSNPLIVEKVIENVMGKGKEE